MGLLSRLRSRTPARTATTAPTALEDPIGGFAVLDLETTGLTPARDRIIEVAVVHLDASGVVGQRWSTLVHPGRLSVGASHVHGLTSAHVRDAPRFEEVSGHVVRLLAGRVLVAHHAAFDLSFLRVELARAGVEMPDSPHLCTLRESSRHLPALTRRRLPDCCGATGIALDGAHSALGDANATAALLAWYLRAPTHQPTATAALLLAAAGTPWPVPAAHSLAGVPRPRSVEPLAPAPVPAGAGRLAALLATLPLTGAAQAPPEVAGYVELLVAVVADGVVTDEEVDALAALARAGGLTRAQVQGAHREVLLSLASAAVADGTVTRRERADLSATAEALGLEEAEVTAVLGEGTAARGTRLTAALAPLPADWSLGEPLRVGDRVAFTGCEGVQRALLERQAREAGLRVTSSVSGLTVALVTDHIRSGTTKARRALELGTRVLHPRTCAVLLDHVQPAAAAPAPTVVDVTADGRVLDVSATDTARVRASERG